MSDFGGPFHNLLKELSCLRWIDVSGRGQTTDDPYCINVKVQNLHHILSAGHSAYFDVVTLHGDVVRV